MTCTLTRSFNHASNGTSHTPSPIAQYNTRLLPPKELTATPIALASSELQSSLSASHQIYPTGMHTIATGRKTQRIDQSSPTHLDIHRWWSALTEAVSHTHSCYTRALSLTDYQPCMHAPRTTHTHTHARTHTHTHTHTADTHGLHTTHWHTSSSTNQQEELNNVVMDVHTHCTQSFLNKLDIHRDVPGRRLHYKDGRSHRLEGGRMRNTSHLHINKLHYIHILLYT